MQRAGLEADPAYLKIIDRAAEDFYTIENGKVPIRDRSDAEQEVFRLEYARIYLVAAGVDADADLVREVRRHFVDEIETHGWTYSMFPDVMPAVEKLERNGVKRAVISNADADVTQFCLHMGFAPHMNAIVTSALVGFEKPDARTYYAALDPLEIVPERALHVGDQALSDVIGAQGIGMRAALIDRYGRHSADEHDDSVLIVRGLEELVDEVIAFNTGLGR
jgi:FMN phosphatase YigB (HAD superfamily)